MLSLLSDELLHDLFIYFIYLFLCVCERIGLLSQISLNGVSRKKKFMVHNHRSKSITRVRIIWLGHHAYIRGKGTSLNLQLFPLRKNCYTLYVFINPHYLTFEQLSTLILKRNPNSM